MADGNDWGRDGTSGEGRRLMGAYGALVEVHRRLAEALCRGKVSGGMAGSAEARPGQRRHGRVVERHSALRNPRAGSWSNPRAGSWSAGYKEKYGNGHVPRPGSGAPPWMTRRYCRVGDRRPLPRR